MLPIEWLQTTTLAFASESVLLWINALGGPVATLLAAWLVAALGVRAYTRQKDLDRKLAWITRACAQLNMCARTLRDAEYALRSKDQDAANLLARALRHQRRLEHVLAQAWLYVSPSSVSAVGDFGLKVGPLFNSIALSQKISQEEAERGAVLCYQLSNTLIADVRGALRLEKVQILLPKPSPASAQKGPPSTQPLQADKS
jgi:hypothetical protein